MTVDISVLLLYDVSIRNFPPFYSDYELLNVTIIEVSGRFSFSSNDSGFFLSQHPTQLALTYRWLLKEVFFLQVTIKFHLDDSINRDCDFSVTVHWGKNISCHYEDIKIQSSNFFVLTVLKFVFKISICLHCIALHKALN